MKEIEKFTKNRYTIEIVKQKEIEYKLNVSILNIHNLTLFEYSFKTQKLEITKKQSLSIIGTDGKPQYKSRVNQKPECVYFLALNKKNALKKLKKHNLPVII